MPPKKPTTTKAAAKPAGKTLTPGGAKSKGGAKGAGLAGGTKAKSAAEPPKGPPLPEVTMGAKQIMPLLTKDTEEILKKSQRWPYIVDPNGLIPRLLQYSDVNLLEVMVSEHMEPERIRMALLGSLRYGKPVVFDMGELDMFSAINEFMDRIHPDLTNMVLTKKVIEEEYIEKLIKSTDDPDYKNAMFYQKDGFSLAFVTSKEEVSDDMKSKMLVVRVE
ncbi:putative IQ motif and ankyrin repeat domain-containing protein [Pecten maximus]|uniref:putative IQ motif and ankyrin repeat domain-containing protein n=1 Tax=Pecten maximus TaxID=6579 RepID=UPI001458CED4|nr:putative IQ motif and ankyrin repeat domain-containing protein [Pecten maximus]